MMTLRIAVDVAVAAAAAALAALFAATAVSLGSHVPAQGCLDSSSISVVLQQNKGMCLLWLR